MFKTKINIAKRDIIWFLIVCNLIIWAISSVLALRFYNGYIDLSVNYADASPKTEAAATLIPVSTEDQVLELAEKAGLNKYEIYALILCESRWDRYAIGDSGKSRGLWQIHKTFHKEVTNECAFDPICSTNWAIAKIVHDGNMSAWTCARTLGL